MNIKEKIKFFEETVKNNKNTGYKKSANTGNVRKKINDWNNINKIEEKNEKHENIKIEKQEKHEKHENIKIEKQEKTQKIVKKEIINPEKNNKSKKKTKNNINDDSEDEEIFEYSVINM